ncbi:MAG: EAL domain-containing protein [Methylococcaceae bacterium]
MKREQIKHIRVLIIEDSEDDVILLVHKLQASGYKVTFEHVETDIALRLALQNDTWDIVLADHSLPNFNSDIALKIVQEMFPELPFIIVSGEIGEDHAVDAMLLGVSDYVMKDNLKRLFPAIERELYVAKTRRLQRANESALQHMAFNDALTGLLNRRGFIKHFDYLLKNMDNNQSNHVLCYLHFEQYKVLSDVCGQAATDKLITKITRIISKRLRKQDSLAWLDGGYFVALLLDCSSDKALKLMESLCSAVEMTEFQNDENRSFCLGMSIGVVTFNNNSENTYKLMNVANEACVFASEEGGNRVHLVRQNDIAITQRLEETQWVSRIHNALNKDLFVIARQKIHSLKNNSEGAHFEILLRLKEVDTLIFPDSFLPAATHYNLSSRIDRWVIEKVCNWLGGTSVDLDKIHLCSINLSAQSINIDGFKEFIKKKLSQSNIPPKKICFEITESTAIINFDNAIEFINDLRSIGCSFSLDDFGSGFCSFSYLKKLPVDFVKIDGAFVRDIVKNESDFAMVKAINDIGKIMGKMTIAEYVETDKIVSMLTELGIDYAQGVEIGKPELIELDI